ncbi:MAG: hypothetical protein V1697_00525 [Candidatus Levyibacteriota bacterium]
MSTGKAEALAAQINPEDRPIAVREYPKETPAPKIEIPTQAQSSEPVKASDIREGMVKGDKEIEFSKHAQKLEAADTDAKIEEVKRELEEHSISHNPVSGETSSDNNPSFSE